MKVLLSVGIGRLHFCEVNLALKNAGIDRSMICGLIPSKGLRWFVNFLGKLTGHDNLYARLERRLMGGQLSRGDFRGLPLAEIVAGVLLRLSSSHLIKRDHAQVAGWKFFGFCSRRFLKHANVFHVRSGAGQGGAINAAKAAGMKIIVDHSIAHPSYMERAIGEEYERIGAANSLSDKNAFWQLVLKDCDAADLLLVNSNFVKQTFVDEGYPADRIRVAHLGIPDYFYGAKQSWERVDDSRVKLLYTGGLVLRKGVRSLLEALSILRQLGVNFRLTVAGDVNEGMKYFSEDLAADDIHLMGFLPREELKNLINQADLYVFPTLSEGCAQSAMEALGAGLPVITTKACGLPGEAGVHYQAVEANDPEGLARQIEALSQRSDLREKLGRAGSELLGHNYTWPSYAGRLKSIYGEVLSQ